MIEGDVAEIDENGRYKIIDRCSFVFKLAQGEWVSPAGIERVLESSGLVHNALIMGDPEQTCVVALVYPTQSGIENTDSLLQKILEFCRDSTLKSWEIPRNIHITEEQWTVENEFLTATGKKNRAALNVRFREVRDQLYKDVENMEESSDELYPGLKEVLEEALAAKVIGNRTFTELGGTSLGAARVIQTAAAKGIHLSNEILFSFTVSEISKNLHGEFPIKQVNFYEEVKLPLDFKPWAEKVGGGTAIFVTGVTGFVGQCLLEGLIHRFPNRHIYCLTRRLLEVNAENVTILNGDLSKPRLGLENETLEILRKEVNWIIHNGCWVDMIRPYSTLKPTNVDSTLFLLQLCSQSGSHFTYVSSLSATPQGKLSVASLSNARLYDGYGQTKAVSEILSMEASNQFQVPLTIIRPGTISSHTQSGYYNRLDYWNLFISTCIHIEGIPEGVTALMDWTPVDVVVSRIIESRERLEILKGNGPPLSLILERLSNATEIKPVPPSRWRKLVNNIPEGHPAYPLRSTFLDACYNAPGVKDIDNVDLESIDLLISHLLADSIP